MRDDLEGLVHCIDPIAVLYATLPVRRMDNYFNDLMAAPEQQYPGKLLPF
jgi:hypothetical protein